MAGAVPRPAATPAAPGSPVTRSGSSQKATGSTIPPNPCSSGGAAPVVAHAATAGPCSRQTAPTSGRAA